MRVRKRPDACKVEHRAGQVGGVRTDDGAGVWAQQTFKIGVVDVSQPVCRKKIDRHAALAQPMERAQDGVVLQIGRKNVAVRVQQTEDRRVERLCGVCGKHHALRRVKAEQRGKCLARVIDRPSGAETPGVGAAPAVAERAHRGNDRLCHAGRLLQRGRRIVKIDHVRASHRSAGDAALRPFRRSCLYCSPQAVIFQGE